MLLTDHSSSDCVQHKLEKKNAQFEKATYDMHKDTLTVDVKIHHKKVSGGTRKIDVTLELSGQ